MKNLQYITITHTKSIVKRGSAIDEDLLLFDNFEDVPLPSEPKRLKCLFVALCLDGEAQYTVDTKQQKIKAGDLIIINEGQVIGDYILSPNCKGIAMMASSDFFQETVMEVHELSQLFVFSHTHPVLHVNNEATERFLDHFQRIKSKIDDTDHHFRREVVHSMLKALIYELGNVMWHLWQGDDTRRTRAESIFSQFIRLVEVNFRHERRVGWYAEQLCITPKYLSETIKSVSKRTPNDWIDNYVVLEIRVLLKNSSMSIKEIASELNFPTQSFLGKYFKEHVGMSPSQYRKQ